MYKKILCFVPLAELPIAKSNISNLRLKLYKL